MVVIGIGLLTTTAEKFRCYEEITLFPFIWNHIFILLLSYDELKILLAHKILFFNLEYKIIWVYIVIASFASCTFMELL